MNDIMRHGQWSRDQWVFTFHELIALDTGKAFKCAAKCPNPEPVAFAIADDAVSTGLVVRLMRP